MSLGRELGIQFGVEVVTVNSDSGSVGKHCMHCQTEHENGMIVMSVFAVKREDVFVFHS